MTPRVTPPASPPVLPPPVAVDRDAADDVGRRGGEGRLGSTVRSGLAWTLGGQWAGYAVQLGTTVALARLVSPRDFGLVGMALTVTAFADQLQGLGLSQAVIQRARLTHGQLSNLFWVNAAVGGLLMVFVAALSPLVARFYGHPALVPITCALSVGYLLAGLGVQHTALIARRLQFRSLALRSLTPRLAAGALAVAAAVAGAGYWSIVIMQTSIVAFSTVLVWLAIDWRPGRPARRTGVRPLLRFGAGVSVANMLNYFSGNTDNILVGRFLGTVPLGLYARAYNLFLTPLRQLHQPLGNVVQPVLAGLADQPSRYRAFYRQTLSGIAVVGMPGVVYLAIMSHSFIEVTLGPRWLGAADVFRWLAVAGFLQMIGRTFTWLFTTSDRPRAMATWALVSSPVIVASFAVGLHWGITGVAASYAIALSILTGPGIWYAVRGTAVSVRDVVESVWRPVVLAAAVGAVTYALGAVLSSASALAQTGVTVVAAAATWCVLVVAWPSLRAEIRGLRGSFGRRRAA